jgi:flavodoxin
MKKAIVLYYSYSGNTKKVANFLNERLSEKFQTQTVELKPSDESKSFLGQCIRAFRKAEARLEKGCPTDLREYDLVCFGTPVWAFGMAPALRAYLNMVKGLDAKKIVLFATYGSGVGKDKCLREMAEIVKVKGADEVRSLLIQQFDVNKSELIQTKIDGLF